MDSFITVASATRIHTVLFDTFDWPMCVLCQHDWLHSICIHLLFVHGILIHSHAHFRKKKFKRKKFGFHFFENCWWRQILGRNMFAVIVWVFEKKEQNWTTSLWNSLQWKLKIFAKSQKTKTISGVVGRAVTYLGGNNKLKKASLLLLRRLLVLVLLLGLLSLSLNLLCFLYVAFLIAESAVVNGNQCAHLTYTSAIRFTRNPNIFGPNYKWLL